MKAKEHKSDCPVLQTSFATSCVALGIGTLISLASVASAQTLVSGNISGTWSPSGNPYIVTDNSYVLSGSRLTIQPGVVVWIGSGLSITNNGLIQAVGTPSQRITIQSPVNSQYWNTISNNYSGVTNLFTYCDFQNAGTALSLNVSGGNSTMITEILNCTFSNCVSCDIYGVAIGTAGLFYNYNATNSPVIKNCVFTTSGSGCVLNIHGNQVGYQVFEGPYVYYTGYGYANPTIAANIFQNLNGTAFLMEVGSFAGGSQPTFLNNTIVGCRGGVNATDPWDALVQDNILIGCTNAVMDSGSLSRQVSYNDFYNNATNFTGYPSTYGTWIIPNRNGTLADVLYNFSQDPLFVAPNDFHLTSSSPCVGAGTPDSAYANECVPPSISTNFPDQGVYGGPDACNWLTDVPLLPVSAAMSIDTNNVESISFGAIPRSTYQFQSATNLPSTNWINLTKGLVLAVQKPTTLVLATNPPEPQKYFRIQSLGRTPGN